MSQSLVPGTVQNQIMNQSSAVYLDNAATTPIRKEVVDAMCEVLYCHFGNPSATHSIGRDAKGLLEKARLGIAKHFNAKPSEIVFTSGGTEADNMAIRCSVRDLGIKHVISAPTEHKAVLDTIKELVSNGIITCTWLKPDALGRISYQELEEACAKHPGSLVSLMHANNEIGTLIDLKKVAEIAHAHACLFHSDTVQTAGHYVIDTKDNGADFLTCSAHKLNGPKGTGFLYVSSAVKLKAMITGGGQEKSLRAGTENMAGIIGMAKAIDLAFEDLEKDQQHIAGLKAYAIERLKDNIPGLCFNGDLNPEGSLYTVLNLSLPPHPAAEMLLFRLDLEGLCVSGGSACNAGAASGSHVLDAIGHPSNRIGLRLSFGRQNTKEDIDFAVEKISALYAVQPA